MTEAEWLEAKRVEVMCSTAIGSQWWSFRKETLFSVACCRRVLLFLPDERAALLLAEFETAALALTTSPAVDPARALSEYVANALHDPDVTIDQQLLFALGTVAQGYISQVAETCAFAIGGAKSGEKWLSSRADPEEEFAQTSIIRDIVGNPFRPITFIPVWRTDTVVSLARQMYESRDFNAMPILADALQDAGCDNYDILNHCRGPGPYVRGCWVVDLVLGKE